MADRGRFLKDVIYESEEIMGPGFFVFFTEHVTVIPPTGGSDGSSKRAAQLRAQQLEELAIEEDDLLDMAELTILSGIIE